MAAEAEARMFGGGTPGKNDGDTFLTDLMMGKKQPSVSAAKSQRGDDRDSEMQDIEEELRDVVFDFDNS